MKNLHRLRGLMLANKLTIDVNYGVLKAVKGEATNDLVNQELLSRIAMMRPETISWSSMLDHLLPEDLHDLARRCSVHGDCVHYGYSTNWPTQVLGASIIDYDPRNATVMINAVLNCALGFSNASLPVPPLPSIVNTFTQANLDKLLFLPFREHPLNGTAYVLAQMYDDDWVEHFVKKGEVTNRALQRLGAACTPFNCGLQIGTRDLALASPLYRSPLTLYMSWCYDPRVRLMERNPFESSAVCGAEMLARLMMMHFGV